MFNNIQSENVKATILKTALLAGKIMMENGSEVYRVEDTMKRIAQNAGEMDVSCYVTATGIFIGLENQQKVMIASVEARTINLEKVVAVNEMSRQFADKKINLHELAEKLEQINQKVPTFPLWLEILAAGMISAGAMYLFGGVMSDFLITFLIGSLGFIISVVCKSLIKLNYFDLFIASFCIGIMSIVAVKYHFASQIDPIIIGSIMPFVPGVAITNAVRDILAGHLISGTARATEALIVAATICAGIATVFNWLGGWL